MSREEKRERQLKTALESGLTSEPHENLVARQAREDTLGLPVGARNGKPRLAAYLQPQNFSASRSAFSVYVHVPFCAVRCGYCDFNTYTNDFGPGADRASYARSVIHEIDLLARSLPALPEIQTVFFGGGTPSQLAPSELGAILARLREWGLAPNAEITTEANPDNIDEKTARALAQGGFTRVSLGMQSSVPHVLKRLDRTHNPRHVERAVRAVQTQGMQVSLDLIYGTPGESRDDWRESLERVLALEVDHVSAYSLVIEPGTKMGAQLRRKLLAPVDGDEQAAKYELADALLSAAGYAWYEISNWARIGSNEEQVAARDATALERACKHNLAYWRNQDWWGLGAGAHSHWQGVRLWNLKHPRAYADAVQGGELPLAGGELVDADGRELERVMLEIRTHRGCLLPAPWHRELERLADEGLVDPHLARDGRARLTLRGRLLADLVTQRLTV